MHMRTIIRVGSSLLRNAILKMLHGSNYQCTLLNACALNTIISIRGMGKLYIGKHLSSSSGMELCAVDKGMLRIGNNVNFNKNCTVICRKKISIGDNCLFGPGCQVFDHDHDYTQTGRDRKTHFLTGEITIGNGVWFGANCVILRNTKIGDNCVFGAGTIIKGIYPSNMLVVQKREEISKSIIKQAETTLD